VTEAIPTEKTAKPKPIAKRIRIGTYGFALTGRKSRRWQRVRLNG